MLVLFLNGYFVAPVDAMPIVEWPTGDAPAATCTSVVLAGVLGDNWEIVVFDRSNSQILNLTRSPDDERDPTWSPDGRAVAFAARRGSNWDVYTLTLADGVLHRLTNSPAYDGRPAFSPDGRQIAFESYRDGNLEIYTVAARGGEATRVTDDPAADVEPIWSSDGSGLIIGSWRAGQRRLYSLSLDTEQITSITTQGDAEPRQPALAPDGRHLAYVAGRDGTTQLVVRDLDTGKVVRDQAGGVQREWPVWQPGAGGGRPQALIALELAGASQYRYPSGWALSFSDGARPGVWARGPLMAGQWERPSCAPFGAAQVRGAWRSLRQTLAVDPAAQAQRGLVTLTDVQALQPRLAAAVAGSFQRLRQRTRVESGYDYAGALNDAWRGLDHPDGYYLSWHKTGRAIDLRDWYAPGGRRALFIARQALGGQTYFRIYLRAARQDGSQGVPLRESLWETDGRLANSELISAGGYALPPPPGYYVDFSDLAEREGWTRIPGLTPPDGDWRQAYIDMEFWHYERRDRLSWYVAMRQAYDDDELAARFTPELALQHGCTLEDVLIAGLSDAQPVLAQRSLAQGPTYAQHR
jgi:TolB protein